MSMSHDPMIEAHIARGGFGFPFGWPQADMDMGKLLEAHGFNASSRGGGNYGPVNHSGRIFEHYIPWRYPLVEEDTYVAGLEVKWSEFPPSAPSKLITFRKNRPTTFQFLDGLYPEGLPTHAVTALLRPRWNFRLYAKAFVPGSSPHQWLDKEAGEWRSSFVYGFGEPVESKLDLRWTRYFWGFDGDDLAKVLIAGDAFTTSRAIREFLQIDQHIQMESPREE